MHARKILYFVAVAVLLPGCANLDSIYRPLYIGDGTGALIDIKQRAIIVRKQGDGAASTTVVCAEPSPDSLSAYAAQGAAKSEKAQLELTAAFQESASFTGLRTSAIQLLRDQLFVSCLSYMNGASTKAQHDLMARRYQKQTVALLAIEQLTGAIKAPPVTINTTGSAEVARSLGELTNQVNAVDAKVADLNAKKENPATTEAEKKTISDQLKTLADNKAAYNKGIENARGLLVSGTATANVSNIGMPTQRGDLHIVEVAATVREIVNNIILTDDTPQLCFMSLANPVGVSVDFLNICKDYYKREDKLAEMQIEAAQNLMKLIQASTAPPEEKKKNLEKLVGSFGPNFGGAAALSNKITLDPAVVDLLIDPKKAGDKKPGK